MFVKTNKITRLIIGLTSEKIKVNKCEVIVPTAATRDK